MVLGIFTFSFFPSAIVSTGMALEVGFPHLMVERGMVYPVILRVFL
jgi:hypothetical protein